MIKIIYILYFILYEINYEKNNNIDYINVFMSFTFCVR